MTAGSSLQVAVSGTSDNGDGGRQLGKVFLIEVVAVLKRVRGIAIDVVDSSSTPTQLSVPVSASIYQVLFILASVLSTETGGSRKREAETFEYVLAKCMDAKSFGGLGLSKESVIEESDRRSALSLIEVWLEALNSQDRVRENPSAIQTKSSQTRPMTLAEKIFAHHTIGGCPVEGIQVGDVVRVSIDWVIASELTWTVSRLD